MKYLGINDNWQINLFIIKGRRCKLSTKINCYSHIEFLKLKIIVELITFEWIVKFLELI